MPSGANHAQALDEQATRRINDLHIAEKLEKHGTREREGGVAKTAKIKIAKSSFITVSLGLNGKIL